MTKNTIALGWEDRVVNSPHLADLGSVKSQAAFERLINDLQQLYQVKVQRILCDAHRGYPNSRWAMQQGLPVSTILHHHAHAAALYADNRLQQDAIIFTWDGVGLGEDGGLWGGETLLGRPGQWRRVATLRPFKLPGNDKVARQPWRSAASIGWSMGLDLMPQHDPQGILQHAWDKDINSPVTSAMGRLFDAVAAILGLCEVASFEGQGPMLLESVCAGHERYIALPVVKNNERIELDWRPLIHAMMDNGQSVADRAALFHNSLAYYVVTLASHCRDVQGVNQVGLSGGVFQNKCLLELCQSMLTREGFEVYRSRQIPCNDGGISFGQLMEWGYRSNG